MLLRLLLRLVLLSLVLLLRVLVLCVLLDGRCSRSPMDCRWQLNLLRQSWSGRRRNGVQRSGR